MSPMRQITIAALWALACIVAFAPVAGAQWFMSEYMDGSPDENVKAAFATPYGQAHAIELAEILFKSADPACLKQKGLGIVELSQRAGGVLADSGARMFEAYRKAIDRKAYDAALAEIAPDAAGELARLRADPDVKQLLSLYEPARQAAIINQVTAVFDSYAKAKRLKLSGPISSLVSDNKSLARADPTDKAVAAAQDFAKKSASAAVKRYEALNEKSDAPLRKIVDVVAAADPLVIGAGLDKTLGDLCVVSRP